MKTPETVHTVYHARCGRVFKFRVRETNSCYIVEDNWSPTFRSRFKKSETVPWSPSPRQAVEKDIERCNTTVEKAQTALNDAVARQQRANLLLEKLADPDFAIDDRTVENIGTPGPLGL